MKAAARGRQAPANGTDMPPLVDLSLARRILAISWPVVIGMLTQTMVNIADTVMVGYLDPSTSVPGQAALNMSLIMLWAVGGFLSSVQVGTQALTARRLGAEQPLEAGKALTNSLAISLTCGLLFSVLFAVYIDEIFPAVLSVLGEADAKVIELGVPYARWRMFNVFSMVVTVSFKAFFDGAGKTYIHMTAALVMNGLNVLLNWLLIFGVWIFPRMEVEGAGLASTIASYVGLAIVFGWTFLADYRKRFRFYRLSNLSRRMIGTIVRLSVPSGLATVAVMSGVYAVLLVVLEIDHAAIAAGAATVGQTFNSAATKIVFDILSVTFMSSIAFGMGTATLVGQSMGARRFDLAARYGWESVKLWAGFFFLVGLVTIAFPDFFVSLFTKSQGVIDAARTPMRMAASVECLAAGGLILAQALFAAGLARFVMLVELGLHFGLLVPGAFVLGLWAGLGTTGVFLAAMLYIALLAAVLSWKWWQGGWKSVQI